MTVGNNRCALHTSEQLDQIFNQCAAKDLQVYKNFRENKKTKNLENN